MEAYVAACSFLRAKFWLKVKLKIENEMVLEVFNCQKKLKSSDIYYLVFQCLTKI